MLIDLAWVDGRLSDGNRLHKNMYSDAEGGAGGGAAADQYGFMSYAPQASAAQAFQPQASPVAWGSAVEPATADADDDFANEPPLLEGASYSRGPKPRGIHPLSCAELGFDFSHIAAKVLGVLHPFKTLDDNIMARKRVLGYKYRVFRE